MGARALMVPAERIVHCQDALTWLSQQGVLEGCSLITSMPDFSEFPFHTLEQWIEWFVAAAGQVLASCPEDGVSIFFQSDIKREGVWVDKGYLCQKAAERAGHALLWHKIVARVPAGTATFGRPGYAHVLCFSRQLRHSIEHSSADVLATAGSSTWARGMGLEVCRLACRYVRKQTPSHTVVAPFCGHGLVLAVANQLGLKAVGIELSRKRAEKARLQTVLEAQVVRQGHPRTAL